VVSEVVMALGFDFFLRIEGWTLVFQMFGKIIFFGYSRRLS
jgi:hypothetical protein